MISRGVSSRRRITTAPRHGRAALWNSGAFLTLVRRQVKGRDAMKIRKVAIGCAVGVLALLALEGALRLFRPQIFPHHVRGLYAPHPELGHVLAPNRETMITQPEYRVTARTNSNGFRGAELPSKSPGTIRIVCFGDWMTFGEGVEDDGTYPVLLETDLRRRYPDRDIQVINAGIAQYGTVDELAYFKSIATELAPDFVILEFYAGDDFEQNQVPSRERHEFHDGALEERRSFNKTTGPWWLTSIYWLKHRSHLVHWVSERAGQAALQANLIGDLENASSNHFSDEQAQRAHELLIEFSNVAQGVGAPTLFVFVPERMQVLARPTEELRAARVVASAADQASSSFLDLTPTLVKQEDLKSLYLHWIGTWTPGTYQLAADAVTQKIVELRWLDGAGNP